MVSIFSRDDRGIHFYEKYGMKHDGAEKEMQLGKPLKCIRYVLEKIKYGIYVLRTQIHERIIR